MADILYLPDTDGDNSDEGVGSDIQNEDSSSGNQYDYLPPLQRLEKHAKSDNIFHRQLVGRLILEALPDVADNPDDVAAVMGFALKVADDPDAPVRAELMEQVPHITMLCHEDRHRLNHVIPEHLLPLVVKFLSDTDNQVRKMSHAALLVMMEQGLIEQDAVEMMVCPVVVRLTELEGQVDYHTGAIALMAKMAPLLGGSKTKELFVPHFAKLCSDHLFYVRKACASFIGDFCAVVGTQATEDILLSKYVALCRDDIWGVRKACAEVIMPVSCKCTMASRRLVLAPAFDALLADGSRWVRASAFATLGPFISTFSPRCISDLAYNHLRELVVVDDDHNEFRLCTAKGGDGDVIVKFVEGSQPFNISTKYNLSFEYGSYSEDSSSTAELENTPTTQSATSSINAPVINAEESSCDNDDDDTAEHRDSADDNLDDEDDENCPSSEATPSDAGSIVREEEAPSTDEITEAMLNRIIVNRESIGVGGPDGDKLDDDVRKRDDVQLPAYERPEEAGDGPPSFAADSAECDNEANEKTLAVDVEGLAKSVEQRLRVTEAAGLTHIHVDAFNAFQYWRVPIPEVSVDVCVGAGKATAVHVTAKVVDPATQRTYAANVDVNVDIERDLDKLAAELERGESAAQVTTWAGAAVTESPGAAGAGNRRFPHPAESGMRAAFVPFKRSSCDAPHINPDRPSDSEWHPSCPWTRAPKRDPSAPPAAAAEPMPRQDVVPQALLDHYVSMTQPAQAQATDNEMAHHCAFSFPAVVMTLGRANWPLVRATYQALATDMQWKVRRTVASSIHEVGLELGLQLATRDLIPIFNDFIKDLDEVRIGALKHLASFLALLLPEERNSYLPRLQEFMLTDNEWNWRFREKLAEQLYLSVPLFEPLDARTYIVPLGYTLLLDKVSAVRHTALNLMKQLVARVSCEAGLVRGVLTDLAQQFAHSKCWCRRQMFALLCARLVAESVLRDEEFARDVLPHLLDLSWDAVPNVRLAVARTLASPVMDNDYFLSDDCPHSELTYQVMKRLQNDVDQDVRVCALAVGTQRAHHYTPSNLRFPIPLA